MTDLIPSTTAPLGALDATVAEADVYHVQARAEATLRAYRADWRAFETWCAAHQLPPLPAAPETVALYYMRWGGLFRNNAAAKVGL